MTAFKTYRVLLGLHLKVNLGLSEMRANWRGGKGRVKTLGFALAIAYALIMGVSVYALILNALFSGVRVLQQESRALETAADLSGLPEAILGAVLGAAMMVCLAFGAMTLFSAVFYARDAERFAAMPLKPGAVFASKFSLVYLYELATAAILVLPACAIYCVHAVPTGGAWLFWLRLIPALLLLPALPLALAALPALALARLTRSTRRRERMNLLVQMFILVFALGLQFFVSGMMQSFFNDDALRGFLQDNEGTIRALPGLFPPAEWAVQAAAGTGRAALVGAALYFALAAGCLAGTLKLAGHMYYTGLLTQSEVSRDTKRKTARRQKPASPRRAVMIKEWRLLTRTPVYVMNTLIGPFILPLMLLLMYLTGRGGFSGALDAIQEAKVSGALMAVGLGVFIGMSLMISGASTMFSREGRGLDVLASFPLSARDIVAGKIACYRGVAWGGAAVSLAMLLLVGAPLGPSLAGFVMAAAAVLPATETQALRDCAAPKRHWTNETEAVKQNLNTVAGMLYTLLILPIPLAVAAVTAVLSGSVWITAAIPSLACVALFFPLRHWAAARAKRMLSGRVR